MNSDNSLHNFVHRTLVYRIAAVGLALSLLVGFTAFFIERNRVSREAIDLAVTRLSIASERYSHLLQDPEESKSEEIRQAIIEFRASGRPDKLGSFVFAGVYDLNGEAITELFDEQRLNIAGVKENQQGMGVKKVAEGRDRYESIRIGGLPYLRVALPLVGESRQKVGIVNGIFAFSDETIASFRLRGLRSMISAVLIVILTSALLYPVILRLARRLTRYSVELLNANLDTLESLGNAIALRDSDTNAHNYRVCIYSVSIGEEVGLADPTMRSLIKGSFLHDIGKIGIQDKILLKPGKLNDNEFEVMKNHVGLGGELVQRSEWLNDALDVVRSHHEKVSGNGYPGGLIGESIPVAARIFAISDVFDALTSKRPYKEAFSFEQAMEIMEEGRGTHFDPVFLDAFGRIARSLYDRFGGRDEDLRDELRGIIIRYFHDRMESLEY